MPYSHEETLKDASEVLSKAVAKLGIKLTKEKVLTSLQEPPDASLGDLSSRLCFELAKGLKKNPKELAEKISREAEPLGMIAETTNAGPYLNFRLDHGKFAQKTLANIVSKKDDYGKQDMGKNKKILLEHTALNPNKALHIGHARNSVLGDTLARILSFLGYSVEVENYVDDTGPQVADTVVGFLKLGFKQKTQKKFDQYCGEVYSKVNEEYEKEPDTVEERKKVMREIEKGKNPTADFAKEMSTMVTKANLESAARINVYYDVLIWESDVVKLGFWEEVVKKLEESGEAVWEKTGENKDCLVLKLSHLSEYENMEKPDKILVRSDKTLTYTAKDIAYHFWKYGLIKKDFKYEEFLRQKNGETLYSSTAGKGGTKSFGHGDKIINVIDARQSYPQQVVKHALKLLGYGKQSENYTHFAYEVVTLKEKGQIKQMSGRRGEYFNLDDLLDKAKQKALGVVEQKSPDATKEFKNTVAEQVGSSAVRYGLVRISPEKLIAFDLDEALDLEGDTSPYLQYTHARASSILRKAGETPQGDAALLKTPEEKKIIKRLSEFPKVAVEAGELRPNLLADYAHALSEEFNTFYNKTPVLKADTKQLAEARLLLVASVKQVLKNTLWLLGINALEKM